MTAIPDDIIEIIKSFLCKCDCCGSYGIYDVCHKCYYMRDIEDVIRRTRYNSWFDTLIKTPL